MPKGRITNYGNLGKQAYTLKQKQPIWNGTEWVPISVATVVTNAFRKGLNYNAKEISQNYENICEDKTHQKPGGHILSRENKTATCHAMEWSRNLTEFVTKLVTAS